MSTSRRYKSGLAIVGIMSSSADAKSDAWHSEESSVSSCHSQRRGRRVLSSLTYPSSMLYPWRGGDAGPLDNEDVDDLIQEENENRHLDTLFLDEFREDIQKVRSDIEADTMGSLYRLRRDILVQRVRQAQKKTERQQQQQETPATNEQPKRGEAAAQGASEQTIPQESPTITDAAMLGEADAEVSVGDDQSEKVKPVAAEREAELEEPAIDAPLDAAQAEVSILEAPKHDIPVQKEETTMDTPVEVKQDGVSVDDAETQHASLETQLEEPAEADVQMQSVEEMIDESLDLFESDEDEAPRERIDVFDDFVIGETDEDEEEVLRRLGESEGDLPPLLSINGKEEEATIPEGKARIKIRKKKSKAKQDESIVKDSCTKHVTSTGKKKSKVKKRKKHIVPPVGGSSEHDNGEAVTTLSNGVKSKVAKKAELKQIPQEQRENTVRPVDDIEDESEDEIAVLGSESDVAEKPQASDTVLFVKTVGLFTAMMIICYLISLVYDMLVASIS